jgi:hypothetical protein
MTAGRRTAASSVLISMLIAAGISGCAVGRGVGGPLDPAPPSPPPLPAGLAERVVETLENDPGFVRKITSHHDRIACVAQPFGTEPEMAAATTDVRVVYSRVYCAAVAASGRLGGGEAAVLPVALTFGPPVTYEVPGDGEGYGDRVRRIFPRRCWTHAFAGLFDPEAAHAALTQRVAQYPARPQGRDGSRRADDELPR